MGCGPDCSCAIAATLQILKYTKLYSTKGILMCISHVWSNTDLSSDPDVINLPQGLNATPQGNVRTF